MPPTGFAKEVAQLVALARSCDHSKWKPRQRGSQFRRVVFVVNNYTDDDLTAVSSTTGWSYLIWCPETGESGNPHIQGYGELETQQRGSRVEKMLGGRAWFTAARGTAEQAAAYCVKVANAHDSIFEHGQPRPGAGSRTDLADIRDSVAKIGLSRTVLEVATSLPAIRVAEKYAEYDRRIRDRSKPVTVFWLWGPSGVGKSRLAFDTVDSVSDSLGSCYVKDATKWWCGYDGDPIVLINEFRPSSWALDYTLQVLDRYPFRVEVKHGYRQLLASTFIITSDRPPWECYHADEERGQLCRRITYTYYADADSVVGPMDLPSSCTDVQKAAVALSAYRRGAQPIALSTGTLVTQVGGNNTTPTCAICPPLSDADIDEILSPLLGGPCGPPSDNLVI